MLPSFIYFFIITLSSTAAVLFSFSASVRTPHYTEKNKGSAQSLWNPFLFNIQSLCASDDFIEHQENINQDSCEPTHSALSIKLCQIKVLYMIRTSVKKKRTFLLILLILQRLRSFSKTWNFQLSIRFPACLKLI